MNIVNFVAEDGSLRAFDSEQDSEFLVQAIEDLDFDLRVDEYSFDMSAHQPPFVKLTDNQGIEYMIVASTWGFEFGARSDDKNPNPEIFRKVAVLLRDYLGLAYGASV